MKGVAEGGGLGKDLSASSTSGQNRGGRERIMRWGAKKRRFRGGGRLGPN